MTRRRTKAWSSRRSAESSRRGTTLIEALAVIALLGAAMVAALIVFRQNLVIWHDIDHREMTVAGFDSALGELRRDVWGAAGLTVKDGVLKLELPGEAEIDWSMSKVGTAIRTTAVAGTTSEREWAELPEIRFEANATGVIVHVAGAGESPDGELRLLSQLRIMRGTVQ